MKSKIISLFFVFALLICNVSIVRADDYVDSNGDLTPTGIQMLKDEGWPSNYTTSLNNFWDVWVDQISDPFDYGSFTHFSALQIFISHLGQETSAPYYAGTWTRNPSNDLSDFSIVVRGMYDEVSNHYGTRESDK